MDLLKQLEHNLARGPDYESALEQVTLPKPLSVRLIAYYLPQFHPIPENDKWWGKGFTEWTNVSKALPRFKGHYQPHLPGELGFYDLRLPQVLMRQAQLVRRYGLEGLCFHHYWFAGRPLLDTPIRLLLEHPEIDLPFCINWANENWSRRWDGSAQEILIGQAHSPKDDLAFAASLEPLLRDPRYIRVGGRPLFMVYRPKILPNAAATVNRWRAHFKAVGLNDPYLVMAQTFGDSDPRPYGMDAAAGFPPHNMASKLSGTMMSLELLDPAFCGHVSSYDEMAQHAMALRTDDDYKIFHGVCPGWDNEARRPGRGRTFVGSTPQKYGRWLESACRKALEAQNPDERIVFINAWNEWAEGAHLEPDRHFGHAYLAETSRVITRLSGIDTGASQQRELPPRRQQRRKLRTLPSLILKNLACYCADRIESAARRVRNSALRLP